ncbi:MAG: two-component regulator propeller domain-containing protein [Candidatus Marinimicrobia bacterium]|nr:two-component regulator propeller domain-containing protein [Candidatus Neomarinimicrobiota bacterium]
MDSDLLWIGTYNGGLVSFDGTDWTVYNTSNSGLPDNRVSSLALDNDLLWIGTWGGLTSFDGTEWTVYNESNSGLPDNDVRSLAVDNDLLWVGTYWGGLASFDGTDWTVYNTSNSVLLDNRIISLAMDNDLLWVGTLLGGLASFDGTNWTTYTTSNSGLLDNVIRSLAINDYQIWIGTSSGLAKYDRLSNLLLTVMADSVTASPGDTVNIDINASFDIVSFSSMEITFRGFQEHLEFIGVDTAQSLLGEAGWSIYANDTDSLLITASGGAHTISGSGKLFSLQFYIPDTLSPGFIPINIEHVLFDESDIEIEVTHGGISIQPNIFYGDVSLNGAVHAYDAALILKHLVGLEDLNPQQLLNANVSLDTTVSALDASLIFQHVAELIDTLPCDTAMSTLDASGNITINDGEIGAGQQIEVPLILTNGDNILSFEGTAEFSPEDLRYDEIIWSDCMSDFTIEMNYQEGVLEFAGAGTVPDGEEEIFATLKFTVKETFSADSTEIALTRLRWNEEPIIGNVASAVFRKSVGTVNPDIPGTFTLSQNYPNPFNPTTTLQYGIPEASDVDLMIFDVTGRKIKSWQISSQQAGWHEVIWNGTNQSGQQVSTGVYIYCLRAGDFVDTKKMVFMK